MQWRKSKRCAAADCVEVARDGDSILVRDSKQTDAARLTFTLAEWQSFVEGVRRGEFDADHLL
jgi:hypothetical protein